MKAHRPLITPTSKPPESSNITEYRIVGSLLTEGSPSLHLAPVDDTASSSGSESWPYVRGWQVHPTSVRGDQAIMTTRLGCQAFAPTKCDRSLARSHIA